MVLVVPWIAMLKDPCLADVRQKAISAEQHFDEAKESNSDRIFTFV